jgi:putative salt-induced outer membrane protein YdiY
MSVLRYSSLVAAVLFLLSTNNPLLADWVKLKNGDRVTGTIVSSDREELLVRTEFMGDVMVQWGSVVEIDSDNPLFVQVDDGQTLKGPVTTAQQDLTVATARSGPVTVPLTAVQGVRSEQSQQEYEAEIERLRNPGLLDSWSGFFDAGYALASGNAETSTLSTSSRIERKTEKDKISVYYNQIYSRNGTSAGVSETTANAVRGGTRYDIDVSDRLFTFAFVDLEFDEFQALDLRNVLGGGLGYHVVQSEDLTFDFFSGAAFNQEFFNDGITRRSGEIVLGEESNWKINARTTWGQRLAIYPNVSESGEYRLQFDSALSTELNSWLAWQVSFSDRFLSNPVLGRNRNDTLLSTGLRVTFGKDQ